MPKRKAKTFNKKNWLIGVLRRASMRYKPANEARNRTKEVYYIKSKHGKPLKRVKFSCEQCPAKDLKAKEKELDHIVPIVGPEGFQDWNTYIDRYLCDADNFQTLCLKCHREKSKLETLERKINKKENNMDQENNFLDNLNKFGEKWLNDAALADFNPSEGNYDLNVTVCPDDVDAFNLNPIIAGTMKNVKAPATGKKAIVRILIGYVTAKRMSQSETLFVYHMMNIVNASMGSLVKAVGISEFRPETRFTCKNPSELTPNSYFLDNDNSAAIEFRMAINF